VKRLVLICIVALAAALPAQAASTRTATPSLASAADFLRTEVRLKDEGRWADAWRMLYPYHQRVALQSDFVYCESTSPFPAQLQSFQVLSTRHSLVHVPGLRRLVPGATVTVRVDLAWYGPRDPITFTHAFHLVPANGHWTWLLSPQRFAIYASASCTPAPAA